MAQISLSFDLGAIHYDQLPLFLAHAAKLSAIYEEMIAETSQKKEYEAPHYEAPPAESLPVPPFAEDKSLEEMSGQELRDRLSDLTGKPRGKKQSPKFPSKVALIAEIQRLETSGRTVEERDGSLFVTTGERRMSEDSLSPAEEADGAASVASAGKKRGIPKGTKLTEEQKAQRNAKAAATREANKAKKAEATESGAA
jgi:hypothetical protein